MPEKGTAKLLDAWISFVSDGLSDGAKTRIGHEVRCKVAELSKRLEQGGLSPEKAFEQAYKELGDPLAAHDEYQRILPETPGQTSLYSWLTAATRGLCDEAKTRITAEIKAHVRESVEHYEQEEVPEDVAYFKAVSALGNPRKARRGFKHSHLTERQARNVARYVDFMAVPGSARRALLLSRIILYTFAFVSLSFPIWWSRDVWSQFPMLVMSCLVLLLMLLLDVQLSKRKNNMEGLYLKLSMQRWLMWVFTAFGYLNMAALNCDEPGWVILGASTALPFVILILVEVRFCRKVMRAGAFEDKPCVN